MLLLFGDAVAAGWSDDEVFEAIVAVADTMRLAMHPEQLLSVEAQLGKMMNQAQNLKPTPLVGDSQMGTLAISYRISNKTVNGRGYKDRRQSLLDAVLAHSERHWMEATSFILAQSKLDPAAMAKAVSGDLSLTDDFVVVFDLSDMSWAHIGSVHHSEILKSFFKSER